MEVKPKFFKNKTFSKKSSKNLQSLLYSKYTLQIVWRFLFENIVFLKINGFDMNKIQMRILFMGCKTINWRVMWQQKGENKKFDILTIGRVMVEGNFKYPILSDKVVENFSNQCVPIKSSKDKLKLLIDLHLHHYIND